MSPFVRHLLIYVTTAGSAVTGVTWYALSDTRPDPLEHAAPEDSNGVVAPMPTPPPPQAPKRVLVTAIHGVVEYAEPSEEDWRPLFPGVEVAVDDSLRTGKGASVGLRVGDGSNIEVAERTELTVREITRSVHRFKLARGRLSAKYEPDGSRVLRVEGTGGAIVETSSGQLGVLHNTSSMAVAAESGSATLSSAGRTVPVQPGRQAVAANDQPPESARSIPVRVLLRATNYHRPLPGDTTAWVQGSAVPGTRVTVNGVSADINADGKFRARIPVRVGRNRVVAVVEDALGRTEQKVLPPIFIEPRGQVDDLTIQWGGAGGS